MIENYININTYCDYNLYDQSSKKKVTVIELKKVFPEALAEIELSKDKQIPIPAEVLKAYSSFRPTPLFRAYEFEKAINTSCEIYIKDEGTTASGNHKANSAYFIAYLCRKNGIKTITTETTGNWGTALAIAAKHFDLEVLCFIDEESHRLRPDRRLQMENVGAKVKIVAFDNYHNDLLKLSADSAIKHTKTLENAVYIFGSVYGYFVVPQTIIGLEAKEQLKQLGKYPDIVVGSCGGGANILGTSSAFIADMLDFGKDVEIFSAEAESCPILSEGKWGYYSIDNQDYYPLIKTYGLDGLINDGKYIGGLGSTIVSPAVSYFHSKGLIESKTFTNEEARYAAEAFFKSEGILVALETGYQLAGVIHKAKAGNKTILVNISSGKNDKQFYGGIHA